MTTGRRRVAATRRGFAVLLPLVLGGCDWSQFWVLDPRGPIAWVSFVALLVDVATMMLIIGPTTLLLVWCIWRYRKATGKGAYRPDWTHSLWIEIVSWGFPLAIVTFLSLYSYKATYALNPFNPGILKRGTSADTDKKPVNVEVVTTDWQWLFIYPDLHIASANQLVIPLRTPIRFRMTSATVPNDFFIPQLAGEIDIMPGMLTKQALIANALGTYEGIAADYSGPGFSWMQFRTRVVPPADFERWAANAAQSPSHLGDAAFDRFATPTINKSGQTFVFSSVENGLFDHVVDNVMAGKVYPTPSGMTEKKSSGDDGRREPTTAAQASSQP